MKKKIIVFTVTLIIMLSICYSTANAFVASNTSGTAYYSSTTNKKYNTYNPTAIESTPVVDATLRVYDFAGLMTEDEEASIKAAIDEFEAEYTNINLVVVTINSNPKKSARDYADDFFDYNSFSNNGVLFLIDMDTRNMWISTTGSSISKLTDSRIDDILDVVEPRVKSKEYSKACLGFVNSVKRVYEGKSAGEPETMQSLVIKALKTGALIGLCGGAIYLLIGVATHKNVAKKREATNYITQQKVTHSSDRFTHNTTTRVYVGSSSSGSSSHHGSSGISHGGGGRGF